MMMSVFLVVVWRRFSTEIVFSWSKVSIDSNIVVCEFSHLGIIDTDDFTLLRCAQSEAWGEVHDPEDDRLCGPVVEVVEGRGRRGAGETTVSIDRRGQE